MLNIQRGLLKSFQPDPLGMSRKYQMFGQVENFSADPCNFFVYNGGNFELLL